MFEHLREPLLCVYLEKAVPHHVITGLDEQKVRRDIGNYFTDNTVA